ncbi:HEAT repeat domain-containing protein [Planctomycetota bacterium]
MYREKGYKSTIIPRGSILVALVLTGMIGLAGCYRSSSRFSDKQILKMMQQPENLPYNYWHGESKWELTEDGSHMLSYGHLEFGRIFTEETDWGVIHGEIYMKKSQRLSKNPLLLIPLLDSKDPDVVLYALHCYEKRSDVLAQHPFENMRLLYDKLGILITEYPDTRVRWKAFRLMTEMHWVSIADLTRALDDSEESVRLEAAAYLSEFKSILEFEKNLRLDQSINIERDIHNSLAQLAIKHINDNHYNIRFDCVEVLKSLIRKSELFSVQIDNKPSDEILDIDWMRESWWKRHAAQKQLQKWWQQNSVVISAL